MTKFRVCKKQFDEGESIVRPVQEYWEYFEDYTEAIIAYNRYFREFLAEFKNDKSYEFLGDSFYNDYYNHWFHCPKFETIAIPERHTIEKKFARFLKGKEISKNDKKAYLRDISRYIGLFLFSESEMVKVLNCEGDFIITITPNLIGTGAKKVHRYEIQNKFPFFIEEIMYK